MISDLIRNLLADRRRSAILTLSLLAMAGAGVPGAHAQGPLQQAPPPTVNSRMKIAETPLVVDEPKFDLGDMIKGTVAHHTFVVRNTGSEPLTITRAFPSCGCTVTEFTHTIPAGGEGEVRAEVDTATLTGKGGTSIGIFVEGFDEPAAVLDLTYNVSPKLLADPGYSRWIYVQHEDEGTIAQTVYSNDGADFDILSVETPNPSISVSFHEATEAERKEKIEGSQWIVTATLHENAPVGAISGFIHVETTHPQQQKMDIPVSGFVRPALFVDPADFRVGKLEIASPRTMTYTVRNFATDPIVLETATSDVPGVSASIEPLQPGRNYRVVVRFDPAEMKEGPIDGEVKIATDNEKVPSVSIDLEGSFERPDGGQAD